MHLSWVYGGNHKYKGPWQGSSTTGTVLRCQNVEIHLSKTPISALFLSNGANLLCAAVRISTQHGNQDQDLSLASLQLLCQKFEQRFSFPLQMCVHRASCAWDDSLDV